MLGMTEDGFGHPDIAIPHYQKAVAARPDLYEAEFSEAFAYVEWAASKSPRPLRKNLHRSPDDTRATAALKALNSGKVRRSPISIRRKS